MRTLPLLPALLLAGPAAASTGSSAAPSRPGGRTPAAGLVDRTAAADRVHVERVERSSATWRPYDADVVRALSTTLPRKAP